MNRRLWGAKALSVSVVPMSVCCAPATPSVEPTDDDNSRPNIVVIVADDLLSTELSCYGGRNMLTPNIDRIAAEGVRFTRAYASTSISVPIRASMYTGLYPARHGSWANHKDTFAGTKTVNEYMAEEGYRVGRAGKNHPVTKSVYKFEEIPGFTVGCTSKTADYTTDGIREFITRDDNPFLLFVCSINPHSPWTWGDPSEFNADSLVLPPAYVDNAAMRKVFTKYLAEVRALDNEVGSVLDVLAESGKADNTVVMFLGEQGPQIPGGKWTCWYPGVHSAVVVSYPNHIEAGTTSDAIIQYEDMLPTFIDIAGGNVREELDGVSFKKVLFGKASAGRRYAYGMHNNIREGASYPSRSIRDDRYAFIWNLLDIPYYADFMDSKTNVWAKWKTSYNSDENAKFLIDRIVNRPTYELYDILADPWELNNLADNPNYQGRMAVMKSELQRWMASQGDPGIPMDVPF